MGCFDSGHGSVFEHCLLNFITTDCSRVFTHELVRHRVGTAFSQTSGRYVAIDSIDFIVDPLLVADPECDKAIQEHIVATENLAKLLRAKLIKDSDPFDKKKKVTSAIRRIAPNGQSNEIGFSLNIRTLRQTLTLRTSPHAEWEIRKVFGQIGDIVENKWPLMLYGLNKVDTKDGLFSWENV
jgi:thymidylate synthase (FAD)